MLPSHAALGLNGVRENAKCIRQEELRDLPFVVRQIIVKRSLKFYVGVLQLNEHQRETVDVQQHVGTSETAAALYPKLGDGQITVLSRIIEINQPHAFVLLLTRRIIELNRDTGAQQAIDLLVGSYQSHCLTAIPKVFQGGFNHLRRNRRIQPDSSLPNAVN